MKNAPLIPFADINFDNIVADKEKINSYNPQRFEMQQLDAVVYDEQDPYRCVGYKDVTDKEFWVRGHMPDFPLMPGVVMCEVAAQLSSYVCVKYNLLTSPVVGLGGLKDIRVRNIVQPGQRLVVMLIADKLRIGTLVNCRFQGFVDEKLVIDGGIIGVPIRE